MNPRERWWLPPVVAALAVLGVLGMAGSAAAQAPAKKLNIVVIFDDDIGVSNISAYSAA